VTLVVSGNTTLNMFGDDCAEEGCPGPKQYGDGGLERTFFWSDDLGWNITGDQEVDVPKEMSDSVIYSMWTVILVSERSGGGLRKTSIRATTKLTLL
jgi:hypothetical protein